jgi:hypothetical protein
VGDCDHAVAIQMDRTAYSDHDKSWKNVQGEKRVLLIVIGSEII